MEKYVVYDIFVHFVDDGESIKKETNSWIRFVHSKEEGINLPIKFGDLYFKDQVQYHIDINNLNLKNDAKTTIHNDAGCQSHWRRNGIMSFSCDGCCGPVF